MSFTKNIPPPSGSDLDCFFLHFNGHLFGQRCCGWLYLLIGRWLGRRSLGEDEVPLAFRSRIWTSEKGGNSQALGGQKHAKRQNRLGEDLSGS